MNLYDFRKKHGVVFEDFGHGGLEQQGARSQSYTEHGVSHCTMISAPS